VTFRMRVFHNGFPGRRIICQQTARTVSRKEQLPGSGQQSASSAVAVKGMPPGDFPRLMINRRQKAASGTDASLLLSTKPHRSARVHIGQIEDRIAIALRCVE
jgi:hypothetical protein